MPPFDGGEKKSMVQLFRKQHENKLLATLTTGVFVCECLVDAFAFLAILARVCMSYVCMYMLHD